MENLKVKKTALRCHDISTGHTVHGHNSGCQHLHGHNYRITFYCSAYKLDALGMVIDFKVIKERLCSWLDNNWDHRFLVFTEDPRVRALIYLDSSVVETSFNPTAENLAEYLLTVVGPQELKGTEVTLVKVKVSETRKCSAIASL